MREFMRGYDPSSEESGLRCSKCGLANGEHAKNCPLYSAKAEIAAQHNRRKALGEPDSERQRTLMREGRRFEYEIFDQVRTDDPRYQAEMRAKANDKGYLPFNDALDIIKKYQPADPRNPSKDFLRELRLAVAEKLNLSDEEADSLFAYTAVGSALDRFHHADAVITQVLNNGREIIVTLDATLNKEKIQSEDRQRSGVIVTELPSPETDEDAYLDAIDGYAEEVVARIHRANPKGKAA